MADRTIKPDDTNDLVLQNNDGSAKLELNEDQTVKVTTGSDAGEDFTVNTSQLVVEGDTGQVGIGRSDPQNELEVHNDTSNVGITISTDKIDGYSDLKLVNDAQTWLLRLDGSNDNLVLRDETSTSTALTIDSTGNNDVTVNGGNLVIGTAGRGIDFSNATDTGTGETVSSSVLDDYEMGSFTITLNSGSVTSASSIGRYIKIGNLVTIYGQSEISSGSSNQLIVNNLPFTASASITNNINHSAGAIRLFSINLNNDTKGVFSYIFQNSNILYFYSIRDNTTNAEIPTTASGVFGFTHTYEVQ